MTEREVLDMLHRRFGARTRNGSVLMPPRYVVAEHVRDAPGYERARVLDAMAIDTWRSAGWQGTRWDYRVRERVPDPATYPSATGALHGFEVKCSRGDWLRELAQPGKIGAFAPYLHHIWLVAPLDVVRDDLPEGWGWLAPQGSVLRLRQRPALLEAQPMPPLMLAAFARAVQQTAERRRAA